MSRRIAARQDVAIEREINTADKRNYIMPNDYRFNRNYPNLCPLRLGCFEQGQATIRIWPMLDPSAPDSRLLPGRVSAADTAGLGGLSIADVLVASVVGLRNPASPAELTDTQVCSYIIAPLADEFVHGIPVKEEPYMLLQRTAHRAKKIADQHAGRGNWNMRWNAYVSPIPNTQYDSMMVPFAKKQFFIVCSIFENGPHMNSMTHRVKKSKTEWETLPRQGYPFGWRADDPLYLLEVGSSVIKNLFWLLSLHNEGVSGATVVANPAALFRFGEPAGIYDPTTGMLRGGKFVTIYNAEMVPTPQHIEGTFATSLSKPRTGQREMGASYQVALSDTYMLGGRQIGPDVPPEQTRMIFDKHGYFYSSPEDQTDDTYMLELMSIEQRCELLARAFSLDPAFLEFCWRERPEYTQFDSVQAVLRARANVVMPPQAGPAGYAALPQQAYPPQQGYPQQTGYQQQPPGYLPQQGYAQYAYQPQPQQPPGFDQMAAMMPPPASPAAAIVHDFNSNLTQPVPPLAPPMFTPPQVAAPVPPVPLAPPAPPSYAQPPVPPAPPMFTPPQVAAPPPQFAPPVVGVPGFAPTGPGSPTGLASQLTPGFGAVQPPWSGDESEALGDSDFDDVPEMTAALNRAQELLQPNRRSSPPPE